MYVELQIPQFMFNFLTIYFCITIFGCLIICIVICKYTVFIHTESISKPVGQNRPSIRETVKIGAQYQPQQAIENKVLFTKQYLFFVVDSKNGDLVEKLTHFYFKFQCSSFLLSQEKNESLGVLFRDLQATHSGMLFLKDIMQSKEYIAG